MFALQQYMLAAPNFEAARSGLYKLGIKTTYDEGRVIFSAAHSYKTTLPNCYVQEANGLILARSDYSPLLIPPRALRFNINTEATNKFLHQGLYHIYRAEDGTCFNMYYYDSKWRVSTSKGLDMEDVQYHSTNKTYSALIGECLATYNMTWHTFIAGLDKNMCYSFGFTHGAMHPFARQNKMWFIQSVNIDSSSSTYLWSSDVCAVAIPSQQYYREPVATMKDLYRLATSALNDYLENPDTQPCFGFILRSANPTITREHSDLYVESSLMRYIRKIWYDNTIISRCHKSGWNKELAICLNAYLDSELHEAFNVLFPQYKEHFERFATTIDLLIACMCSGDAEHTEQHKSVARSLITNLKSTIKYDIDSKTEEQKKRVFTEYIVHPRHIQLLYTLVG
jgi:hypothetical protein